MRVESSKSSRERMVLARRRAIQRMDALVRIGGLAAFCCAVYFSGRLGVEMARNRLPKTAASPAAAPGGQASGVEVGENDSPLYLAQSPEILRRFFAAYPTPEERAAADLTGLGIRRLKDAIELTTLRADADAVEVKVNSGAIAGAVYWIHHSQISAPSTFDPIVSPVPGRVISDR